jgi:ETC complex I subunit conserved region
MHKRARNLDETSLYRATEDDNIRGKSVSAHIYQMPKNAMQSGKARMQTWVLEHLPKEAKKPDPLTGWAGSGDTRQQLRLTFPSLEAAKAYATREGIDYHISETPAKTLKIQAYADNFR